MIKLYITLFCVVLSACGTHSVSKPSLVQNAESYDIDAMQAYQNEDWVKAQRLFNRALVLYQAIDDRKAVLNNHINLVEVALSSHNMLAVQPHLIQAEDIVSTEGLSSYQARITLLKALFAIQQQQMLKAAQLLRTVLPEFVENELEIIPSDIQLAAIGARTDIAFAQRLNESVWVLRYGNAIKKIAANNKALEAKLLRFQARLSVAQGHSNEAIVRLKQALAIYKEKLYRSGIAGTLLELGLLYLQQNDRPQAINYFQRAMRVFQSLGNTKKVNEVTARLKNI